MTAKREFLTTNEVAQIIGISPFTVRRYIQTRKLKAVKLEGSYRVRQSHLEDFIRAREIDTAEELAARENSETDAPRKIVTPIQKKQVLPPARASSRKAKPRVATRRKEER